MTADEVEPDIRNANAAAPLPLRLTADALQQARQADRAAWASPPWTRLKWRWLAIPAAQRL
ncbi:MAG TPA: hypothetical protein VFV73_42755 [Streptosporangiaceae bacterium]|nr:hypothetical protein [Streptosporangiaceae bacterium]